MYSQITKWFPTYMKQFYSEHNTNLGLGSHTGGLSIHHAPSLEYPVDPGGFDHQWAIHKGEAQTKPQETQETDGLGGFDDEGETEGIGDDDRGEQKVGQLATARLH